VQRGDHLGALADRRGDAFDRGCANVADGEHAAPAGLQRVLMIARIGTGQHKAFGIERDAGAGKPIGVRLGADEQEQVPQRIGMKASGVDATKRRLAERAGKD